MPQQNHLDQRAKVPRLQVAKETSAICREYGDWRFYKLPVKGQERERERESWEIMHRYRYLCGLDII